MNGEILLLFVILLLALILSTYLGGENGIYPIVEGMTANSNSKAFTYTNYTTYVAENGSRAEITAGTKGNNLLTVTTPDGKRMNYATSSGADINTFYASDGKGGRAIITTNFIGNPILTVTNTNGSKVVFYVQKNPNSYFSNLYYVDNKFPSSTTYVGANGSIAKIINDTSSNSALQISDHSGYEKYTKLNDNPMNNMYGIYNNSLPTGIFRSQIPAGQEDLYILKSEVVPPICPKCPDPIVKCDSNNGGEFDQSKCRPCPAPERCPEPSFECKRVPTYKAFNQDYMPVPVLNSFSTFGM